MKRFHGAWLLFVTGSFACGSGNEASKPVTPAAAAAPKHRPKVKRSLSTTQVQGTMRRQVPAMAACYELSPSKSGELAGELVVEFTVEANGIVSEASLANDALADKVLAECVLGVVRKTEFPKAGSSTDVSWPLRFGAH
jgi:hypothetical protein